MVAQAVKLAAELAGKDRPDARGAQAAALRRRDQGAARLTLAERTPCWQHGQVTTTRVLGADACREGWVGIAWSGREVRAYVHAEIGGLAALALADGPIDVVGIDIPIGLADCATRQADLLARAAAGARWASVFVTPVRSALALEDHHEATELNRRLTGSGISRQAFNLRDKILQVDAWLADAPCAVVEVHPELSFGELAGFPLTDSKSTWSGAVRRRHLLADAGIDDLGRSRPVRPQGRRRRRAGCGRGGVDSQPGRQGRGPVRA